MGSEIYPIETSDDEMTGGCAVGRRCAEDEAGGEDGVTGSGDSKVTRGKWRMAECEEVEDGDINLRAEAGRTDYTQDDESEEEEVEQDQEGGMGYSKVLKGKQRMVECEEVEDEDANVGVVTGYSESGGSEEDYEDNDEEVEKTDRDEEDEILGGHRMLWKCDVCEITMNIFARDNHLRSRLHIQNARPITLADRQPPPTLWWCPVCDEEMNVFHLADHLAGKQHQKMVSINGAEDSSLPHLFDILASDEYANLPPLARSSSFELRSNFYCITCAEEFDLSEQDLHLEDNDIWVCAPCSARVHLAAREHHLNSEMHMMIVQGVEKDIFCSVCQQSYKRLEMADHLAGLLHTTMLARTQFEALYLSDKKGSEFPAAPLAGRQLQASGDEETQRTNHWYCDICKHDFYESHCLWHQISTAPAKTKRKREGKAKRAPLEGSLYCDVCQKYKKTEGMADHMKSKKHKKKAAAKKEKQPPTEPKRKIQATNPGIPYPECVVVSGNSFYYKVCTRHRKVEGMKDHIGSKKHRKGLAASEASKTPIAENGQWSSNK